MTTEVSIWHIDLTRPTDEAVLSAEERARAVRLVMPAAKRRFAAARVGLREVLARLTGLPPAALTFTAGDYGKPYLTGVTDGLHFNLSHSADVALVAIATVPVGVDIEQLRWLPNLAQMAEMALTDDELAVLTRAEEHERTALFCRMWTRKEAVMKAEGSGFRLTKSFSLADQAADKTGTMPYRATVQLGTVRYTVSDVPLGPDYMAAVAAMGDDLAVTIQHLD